MTRISGDELGADALGCYGNPVVKNPITWRAPEPDSRAATFSFRSAALSLQHGDRLHVEPLSRLLDH